MTLYTSYGCASCRKAKEWLKERNIPFEEKNIFKTILEKDELKNILRMTENGTDDIVSKRSKIITENNIDIDDMTVDEFIEFVRQNPSVLKRPIIIDDNKFMVGYDAEDIEMFKPRELRRLVSQFCDKKCPSYDVCGKIKEEA